MTRHDRQSRWYAKLLSDPVRLAAFRTKTRKAQLDRYHGTVKRDPAKLAAKRKASRESAARKRRNLGRPVKVRMPHDQYLAKRRAWSARWRAAQREHVRAYNRQWRKAHPEAVKAAQVRSYPARQARKKGYYHANPAPVKARVAKWQAANRDKVRDYPVRVNLAKQIGCKTSEVPGSLLSLIRAHLNLKRELRSTAL